MPGPADRPHGDRRVRGVLVSDTRAGAGPDAVLETNAAKPHPPLPAQPRLPAHARLSVNSLSSLRQTLAEDLEMWQRLGVDHVGLISPKLAAVGWGPARRLIEQSGVRVSNVAAEYPVLEDSLRLAADVGATAVYVCSGPGRGRSWEEAAEVFREEIGPSASLADDLGVRLGVEPTNPLRTDLSFVFSLRDSFDLAEAAGVSVVADLYSCWYERDFEDLVRRHLDRLALVQVCDYVLGTFDTPNRAVPGDGVIPLPRLLSNLADAGYEGAFDLEILGPRIEAEGYESALQRSVAGLTRQLTEAGVPG